MERLIKDIEDKKRNLKELELVLQSLKIWLLCKRNGLKTLEDYDLKSVRDRIDNISIKIKDDNPEMIDYLEYLFNLLSLNQYEIEDKIKTRLS